MQNICKVYETTNIKEVNKKILKGWSLLDLYTKKNRITFVLGKTRTKSCLKHKQVQDHFLNIPREQSYKCQ